MAKALAIRNVQTIDGRVFVDYSYNQNGTTPPAQQTGGIEFINLADLKQRILALEDQLGEEVYAMLHLAITYIKPDGSLNNLNQVTNRTLTFDTQAAQPLKVQ